MKIFFYIFALIFTSSAVHASDLWTLKNDGATSARMKELKGAIAQCTGGLERYFKDRPKPLLIIAYGSRDDFVQGLQNEHGFSKERAEYYKKTSAPRPLAGKLLVPPDQKLVNVCHEFVHHFLEVNTDRDNLLNAKWFDEGVAGYLSYVVMNNEDIKGRWARIAKEHKSRSIPLDKMETEKEWRALHKDLDSRNKAYIEAAQLVEYFFDKYHLDGFQNILYDMKTKPFKKAFKNVTGISPARFYREWNALQ